MGNNSSRNVVYEKYYSSIQNNQEIDLDPYEILGINKNFDWEELKTAYRRVAKLVHPDKGGSELLFNKVTEAFKLLAQEYKSRQNDKPFNELREESRNILRSMPTRNRTVTADENFNERFNRIFDENKLEDEVNADGYGHMMAKSSKVRDDINVEKVMKSFNKDVFNKKFEEVTLSTLETKEITKYKEPEALPLSRKLQYTELGGDRPSEYSSTNEGEKKGTLQYTDYIVAHTTTRLVDPRLVETRKNFKSVEDYEKSREKALKRSITQEERDAIERQKNLETQREDQRLKRLAERDRRIAAHHQQVNRLPLR
jgi:curved DNA-binding protein CbpA